ncbi:MAG TPA: hypothetical protein DDX09_11050 [Hyphomonas atlantica]|nr:hypothetical protein [Hyphomonas atlantica]
MRVPKTKVQDRLPALFASMIAAAASASPALADAAPIVYKSLSDSGRVAAERQTVFITPDQARPNADKARARVQFSYPGSNAPSQANQAVEPTSGDSPHSVREYASISMPIPSSAAPVVAEVVAPKAFDPRAAAREVAAQREPSSVEVSPLATLAKTRTQEPKEQGIQNQPPLAEPRTITPDAVPVFDQTGAATVFGDEFQGLPTANGELFDQSELMAAHPSLPLPSLVQVVNLDTNAEVVVRVNDRGPFEDGAMLQVSERAATELGMAGAGRLNVRVRYLGPAPIATPKPQSAQLAHNTNTHAARAETFQVQPTNVSDNRNTQAYQPVSVGNYFVQVGAFSQIGNAESLIDKMPANVSAQIDPARVNGADFFRVRVGPFSNRDAADRTRDDLARQGLANSRVVARN